jgi:invasion protein IalB
LAAAAALFCGAAQAQQQQAGQAADAAPAAPAAWGSQCAAIGRNSALDCSIFQRGVTQTGQLIGSVSIRIPPDTGKAVLVISAPLGLYVPAGISYSIDGAAPQTMPIETCDQTGCFANQPVTGETLNAMLKGQKITVTFSNMSKQSISLPLSLTGFAAAYGRIK